MSFAAISLSPRLLVQIRITYLTAYEERLSVSDLPWETEDAGIIKFIIQKQELDLILIIEENILYIYDSALIQWNTLDHVKANRNVLNSIRNF